METTKLAPTGLEVSRLCLGTWVVADERGLTVAQLAIAWTLANPAVDVAIVGARHPGHGEQSAPAGEAHLDEDSLARIDRIMADAAVGGPSSEM